MPGRIASLALACLLAAAAAWGCSDSTPEAAAPAAPARADLSRLVVVGDSLSAGVQNGVILAATQERGYASLLARQAGVDLPLPLLAPAPGRRPPLVRIDPAVQPRNLAVPGAEVEDLLLDRPDLPVDSLVDLVLGLPGLSRGIARTQVEWAEQLAPTAILLWIGNNDALGAAVAADAARLTPLDRFEAALHEVVARLAATGAALAVANVPDVTRVPFLTPAEAAAARLGRPLAEIGPLLGIGPGDFLTPEALAPALEILAGQRPGPLPSGVVLEAAEAAAVRARVAAFNAAVAREAAAAGAALVDVHALVESAAGEGLAVGDRRLTVAFLGGLFSLDGIHPTDTGYAVVANLFIEAVNRRFGAGILALDAAAVAREDPLVPPRVAPGVALGAIAGDVVEAVVQVLDPARRR